MQSSDSKAGFLFKLCCAGILPLALLVVFIVTDPFKIIWNYDSYSYSPVVLNRDYVSVEYYLKHQEKYNYNAYIFGNSQTLGFLTTDWMPYLPQNSKPYHFDASAESLYGIVAKLRLIRDLNNPLDHAILFINEDNIYMTEEIGDGHIFIKHPAISAHSSYSFYLSFFKVYFQKFFFFKHLDMLLTGHYKSYMKGFLEPRKVVYTAVHNDLILEDMEQIVSTVPDSFYSAKASVFANRDTLQPDTADNFIGLRQIRMLSEIASILKSKGTKYKIVIAPNYTCRASHPKVIQLLQGIFGNEQVYNFSGKSTWCMDQTNYYDPVHFRPVMGKKMLESMYRP